MAKNKSGFPGKTQFDQAMNCIGNWIFEHGLRGDLDIAVSTRRIATTTTITVLSPDGVMQFTFSDADRDAKRALLVPRDPADRQRGRS